jgi:polyhydroxyalkanoate synthesis regulator phasin
MTSERAQKVMDSVWESRNSCGADTENKLTAAIVRIISENVINYTAQNDLIVLDKNDMLNLASEIESLE